MFVTKCGCKVRSVVTKFDSRTGEYVYVISTGMKDCDKEIIPLPAWEPFADIYPLLHEHRGEPVGTAKVFVRDGKLWARVTVTDPDVRAFVESGALPAASVGFTRLASTTDKDGTIRTSRARLREISLVSLACNWQAHRVKATPQVDVEAAIREGIRAGLKAAVPPKPKLISAAAVKSLVARESRRALHDAAIQMICDSSGALDASGIKARVRTDEVLATAVRAIMADVDTKATRLSAAVCERISERVSRVG